MPQWAIFPEAWQAFVDDPEVQDSAIKYIRGKARKKGKKTLELVEYAERKSAKNTIYSAWKEVAEAFGLTHLKFGYTWTAVSAMPIKIATALGWKPPKPRPQWAERDGVIIAKP